LSPSSLVGKARVAALITARGGSKGLPRKNILPLAGKPLIAYSIEASQSAHLIDSTYLSSDDPEIIAVAESLGCAVPFVRDAHLARDTTSSLDVVLDAFDRLPPHDIWVLLQPTSPLRTADDIDAVVALVSTGQALSAATVREANDHPFLCFSADGAGLLHPFCQNPPQSSMRRQDLPNAYMVNGSVYAFTPAWLKDRRKFVDSGSAFHVMSDERSIDIDTIEDFSKAEAWLNLQSTQPIRYDQPLRS